MNSKNRTLSTEIEYYQEIWNIKIKKKDATQKRHFLTLTPSRLILINLTLCVAKAEFRNSFVALKNIALNNNHYTPRYKLVTPHSTFWSARQLKTIHNNTFRPTSSSTTLLFPTSISEGLTTLGEETTQRKHTYVTPSSSLNQTNLSLLTNNKNSGYKNGFLSLNNNTHFKHH